MEGVSGMTKRELLEALQGMQELLRWQGHVLEATISALQRDVGRSGPKQAKPSGSRPAEKPSGD